MLFLGRVQRRLFLSEVTTAPKRTSQGWGDRCPSLGRTAVGGGQPLWRRHLDLVSRVVLSLTRSRLSHPPGTASLTLLSVHSRLLRPRPNPSPRPQGVVTRGAVAGPRALPVHACEPTALKAPPGPAVPRAREGQWPPSSEVPQESAPASEKRLPAGPGGYSGQAPASGPAGPCHGAGVSFSRPSPQTWPPGYKGRLSPPRAA